MKITSKRNLAIITFIALAFLLTAPLILWHVKNKQLPNDDAADFLYQSVSSYQKYCEQGAFEALKNIYLERGWRPILFPGLAVPFLIFSSGSLKISVAATMIFLYLLLLAYTYLTLRIFLALFPAVICAAAILLTPWIFEQFFDFYAETAMLAFCVAAVYHAYRSDFFSLRCHSIAFGVSLGIALTMRPSEVALGAAVPVFTIIFFAFRSKRIAANDIIASVIAFAIVVCVHLSILIGLREWIAWVIAVSTLSLYLYFGYCGCSIRKLNFNYTLAVGALLSIVTVWWLPHIKEFFEWFWAATGGGMVRLSVGSLIGEGIIKTVQLYVGHLGGELLLVLILTALIGAGYATLRGTLKLPGLDLRPAAINNSTKLRRILVRLQGASKGAYALYVTFDATQKAEQKTSKMGEFFFAACLILFGSIYVLFTFITVISFGGGDYNRAFLGFYLILIGMSILSATHLLPLKTIRLSILVFYAVAQFITLINVTMTAGSESLKQYQVCPLLSSPKVPFVDADPSTVVFEKLYATPLKNAPAVACFYLSLFEKKQRSFDAPLLSVLALRNGCPTIFGYPFTFEDISQGYERLRDSYSYCLIDLNREFPRAPFLAKQTPYLQLTNDIISRVLSDSLSEVGLRLEKLLVIDHRSLAILSVIQPGKNLLKWQNNLALSMNGAIAGANSSQIGFPVKNINDGSNSVWGSLEGNDDVFAFVELPEPKSASKIRIMLFSPNGMPHLREFSVIVSNSIENSKLKNWKIVKARLSKDGKFLEKIECPILKDKTVIELEIDPEDRSNYKAYGIACFRGSRSDQGNYVKNGNGVYFRELQIAKQENPLRQKNH